LEVLKENDLKDIKLEMDVFDTTPGKMVERNPKKEKEKEPGLSV